MDQAVSNTLFTFLSRKWRALRVMLRYGGLLAAIRFQFTRGLVEVRVPGWSRPVYIRGRSSDFATLRQIFEIRHYDTPLLPESAHDVFDLGGNIGLSAIFFKLRYPQARIVVIEPASDNFTILERNLSGVEGIELLKAAVMPDDGRVRLVNAGAKEDCYIFAPDPTGDVLAISPASLMSRVPGGLVDVMKVDIEGGERALFLGDVAWLRCTRVLLCEVHDMIHADLMGITLEAAARAGMKVEPFGEGVVMVKAA